MASVDTVKKKLKAGKVYRREDLAKYSKAIDRHLAELVDEGALQKLAQGLYYAPKLTSFGPVPPDENELIKAYLKGDDYLITSPNYYNALELGTTQLYNTKQIYNHKKHDDVKLGNRVFQFRRKPKFPKKLSQEYLVIDLLNNLKNLAEDNQQVLKSLINNLNKFDKTALRKNLKQYGSATTKKLFDPIIAK